MPASKRTPLTYQDCQKVFRGKGKVLDQSVVFKIAPNTFLERCGTVTAENGKNLWYSVVFHGIEIIRFHENGSIQYFSGGHRTVTTKARLNQFGLKKVYQTKHQWYVEGPDGVGYLFSEGVEVGNPQESKSLFESLEDAALDGDRVALALYNDYIEEHNVPQDFGYEVDIQFGEVPDIWLEEVERAPNIPFRLGERLKALKLAKRISRTSGSVCRVTAIDGFVQGYVYPDGRVEDV